MISIDRPSCATTESELNERLFAHIHLDHRLAGSHLQGTDFLSTTNYVIKMMEYLEKNSKIPEDKKKVFTETLDSLRKKFKTLVTQEKQILDVSLKLKENDNTTLKEINNSLNAMASSIVQELNTTDSILIPGGWAGTPASELDPDLPGHQMCYQLIKNKDKSYTFLIYNTGAGISHHLPSTKFHEKYRPIMAFKIPGTLPEKELQSELIELISNRLAPMVKPLLTVVKGEEPKRWYKEKQYDGSRIYSEIIGDIATLGGSEIDPRSFSRMTTMGQFAGTCAMRVLMPLLHSLMPGEMFPKFLYQFRLQSTIDHFRIQQSLGKLSEKRVRRQLKSAISKLSHTTHKMMSRSKNDKEVLSEEEGSIALMQLRAIREALNQTSQKKEDKKIISELNHPKFSSETINVDLSKLGPSGKLPILSQEKKSEKESCKNLPDRTTFKNPLEFLKECYEVLFYNAEHNYTPSVVLQIERLFLDMPSDIKQAAEYWRTLTPEQASFALTYLQMIHRIYTKSTLENEVTKFSNPRQVITSTTILAMSSFVTNQYFTEQFGKGHFSRFLPKGLYKKEIESTSCDPLWDKRSEEIQQLIADLYTKEGESTALSKDKDEYNEYYDEYFLKRTLDEDDLNYLVGFHRIDSYRISEIEKARKNFYEILKSPPSYPLPPKITQALKDYHTFLHFNEMVQESRIIAEGKKQYCYPEESLIDPNQKFDYRIKGLMVSEKMYGNRGSDYGIYRGYDFRYFNPSIVGSDTYEKLLNLRNSRIKRSFQDSSSTTNERVISVINEPQEEEEQYPKRKFSVLRFHQNEGRVLTTKTLYHSNLDLLNNREEQTEVLFNFFTPKILNKLLKRNSDYTKNIIEYLINGFKYHIQNNRVSMGGIFLYQLAFHLYKYLKVHPESHKFTEALNWIENLEKPLLESIKYYENLLKTEKDKKAISEIYGELLAAHLILKSEQKNEKLSNESLAILLESYIYQTMRTSDRALNSIFYLDLYYAKEKIYNQLKSHFELRTQDESLKLLHSIFSKIWVPDFFPDSKFEVQSDFPKVYLKRGDKEITFDFLKGKIESASRRLGILPNEVYIKSFTDIFGNDPIQGTIQESYHELSCNFVKEGKEYSVEFNKQRGRYGSPDTLESTKILMKKGIDQWYELCGIGAGISPHQVLPFYPGLHNLDPDKRWWRKMNEPLSTSFICTDLAGNYLYEINEANTEQATQSRSKGVLSLECQVLQASGERSGFKLLPSKGEDIHPLFGFLSRFEDRKFIEIWQAENLHASPNPYRIKLPRYDLEWIAQKTDKGEIEYVWTRDKSYRLIFTEKEVIEGFPHTLSMIKKSVNKKTGELSYETIVLVPQQEFYPSGKEDKLMKEKQLGLYTPGVGEDEYYELEYDRANTIEEAALEKFLFGKNKNPDLSRENYFYSHSKKYNQFKLKQRKALAHHTLTFEPDLEGDPVDYLQLAYIYLGLHEPEQAMDALIKCSNKGGIQGNLEEVELIRRIITEIPNKTYNISLYNKAKTSEPNTIAAQMFAASLLSKQMQASLNKPKFSLEAREPKVFTSLNEEWNAKLEEQTVEFYKTEFQVWAQDLCKKYNNAQGNVSIERQINPEDELLILKIAYNNILPEKELSVLNRWHELEVVSLKKAQEKLLKQRAKNKKLSLVEETELKEIQEKLTSANLYTKRYQQIKQKSQLISVLPRIPNLSPEQMEILVAAKLRPEYYRYGSSESEKQNFEAKWGKGSPLFDVKLEDLSIGVSTDKFLALFQKIYVLATHQNYYEAKTANEDRETIKKFVKKILFARVALDKIEMANPVYDFCVLLNYIFERPERRDWPRMEFRDANDFNKFMIDVQVKCMGIYNTSPLTVQIESARVEKKPKLKPRVVLDHKETIERFNLSAVKKNPYPLLLDGGLENLRLEVQKIRSTASELVKMESISDKKPGDKKFITEFDYRFQQDLRVGRAQNLARKQQKECYRKHLLEKEKLEALEIEIQNLYAKENIELIQTREKLIEFANQALTGTGATTDTQALVLAQKISALKLENLIWLYLQGDPKLFREKTRLDEDSVQKLYEMIHDFLLRSTANQQRERLVGEEQVGKEPGLFKKLKSIQKSGSEYESTLVQIGDLLTSERSYEPALQPELLVFEYYDDKLLRESQVKTIEQLLEKEGDSYRNEVIQLIMGGGKSKVLLPLLAVKKASGTNLSLIVVPSSLFETNKADLGSTIRSLFGVEGFTLEFDRDSPCASLNLNLLLEKLQSVVFNREYVIATSETIQSLQLKYLELLDNLPDFDAIESKLLSETEAKKKREHEKELEGQIITLEKILVLLKNKGDGLIDECDTVLDPNRELNYTQGSPRSVPNQILKNIQQMYRLFPLVPIKGGNLQDIILGKAVITSDEGWQEAMEGLARVVLENPVSPLYKSIKRLSPENLKILKYYLLNELPKPNEFELPKPPAFMHGFGEELLSLIGLVKGELELFRNCLKRKPNEHYGFPLSKNFKGSKETAIPYVANNTPNERAEFGSVYEIINYTLALQDQRETIPIYLIEKMIIDFKRNAKLEVTRRPGIGFDETKKAKEFFELTGLKLSAVDLNETESVKQWMMQFSQNTKVRDYIVLNYVLTQIKEYPFILRSNAINFTSQLHTHQALSGTTWNAGCYDINFHYDEAESLGTDGRTVDTLIEKDPKIHISDSKSSEYLIDNFIMNHANSLKIQAFIDLGALFKGLSNEKIAETLALKLGKRPLNLIKHILYFNEDNELCALPFHLNESREVIIDDPIFIGSTEEKAIEAKIGSQLEYCFTYYDQRHTSGTDIRQPLEAIGMTTVDSDTTTRDLLQGVMRLRDFYEFQNINIILPQEVALSKTVPKEKAEQAILATQWTIQDILDLTQKNQKQVLSNLHFRSALDKMDNVVRQYLFDRIIQEKNIKEKRKLRKIFSEMFVSAAVQDPFLKFGKCEQSLSTAFILKEVIEQNTKTLKKLLEAAKLNFPEGDANSVRDTFKRIEEQALKNCLSTYKHIPNREENSTSVVQTVKEKKSQKLKETKKEVYRRFMREVRRSNLSKSVSYKTWAGQFPFIQSKDNALSVSLIPLNQMLKSTVIPPNFEFSNEIYVTENFIKTAEGQIDYLDDYFKPINFFIGIKEPQSEHLKIVIISDDELQELLAYYDKNHEALKKEGYEILFKNTHDEFLTTPIRNEKTPGYKRLLEQVQFLNGDLDQLVVKADLEWLLEERDKKLEFLRNTILPNNLEQTRDYDNLEETLQLRKLGLMEYGSKVNFEMLYMAIESNNLKQLDELLKEFVNHSNLMLQRLMMNDYPPEFKEPLLHFAVRIDNSEMVKRLLLEKEVLAHVEHETSPLFLAFNNESLFKTLLEDQRIFPDSRDEANWSSLLKEILASNQDSIIHPFLEKMKKICKVNEKVVNKLLPEYYKSDIKTINTLLPRLETLYEKGDQFKVWQGFIEGASKELPVEEAFKLLEGWFENPPNQEVKEFISNRNPKKPHLFQAIYNKRPDLFQKLLQDKRFGLENSEIQNYDYLFNSSTASTLRLLVNHLKHSLEPKMLEELARALIIQNTVNTFIKTLSSMKSYEPAFAENREKLFVFLEFYPSLAENSQTLHDIFLQIYRTLGNEGFAEVIKIIRLRSEQYGLLLIYEYLPLILSLENINLVKEFVSTFDFRKPENFNFGLSLQEAGLKNYLPLDFVKQFAMNGIITKNTDYLREFVVKAYNEKDYELLEILFANRAPTNFRVYTGTGNNEVIFDAIEQKDHRMIELLLKSKVNLNVYHGYSWDNVFKYAISLGNKDGFSVAKFLLKSMGDTASDKFEGYTLDHLFKTLSERNFSTAIAFEKLSFTTSFEKLQKPLLIACRTNDLETVKALYPLINRNRQQGNELDSHDVWDLGEAALETSSFEVFKYLCRESKWMMERISEDRIPVIFKNAVSKNQIEVLRILAEHFPKNLKELMTPEIQKLIDLKESLPKTSESLDKKDRAEEGGKEEEGAKEPLIFSKDKLQLSGEEETPSQTKPKTPPGSPKGK